MVELLSKSSEDQEQWQRLFADMQLGRDVFEGVVRDVAGKLKPVNAVARLLSPGRSGARVVVVSFQDEHERQSNLVMKLVPPGAEGLLQREREAIAQFAGLLYPDLEVTFSPSRAIAYSFFRVLNDLSSWLHKCTSDADIGSTMRRSRNQKV